jgi:glycosyltransferase involved in cell wall biosynthesis
MKISVIMPAYNEATRIGTTVREAQTYAAEVVVLDDGSIDGTVRAAEEAGAPVLQQQHEGYIAAIKRGFREAKGEVVVTMDADGEHRAADIPRLVAPIEEDRADLVLGARAEIARPSERFLNWLTHFRVQVSDSGTGFRALRRNLGLKLKLRGRCICGISVLEPAALGARIVEVLITLKTIDKPRRIAWYHLPQVWYVLQWLIKPGRSRD